VLGRSLDPLVVLFNMYKNRYGTVPILVSMFGGCSERHLDDFPGLYHHQKAKIKSGNWVELKACIPLLVQLTIIPDHYRHWVTLFPAFILV
jgi:hypothetical protein